jgi:Na+/melibiose symporter-like transporter
MSSLFVPGGHPWHFCNQNLFLIALLIAFWRSALFWAVTQRVVEIYYRRFRTTYRSHHQGKKALESYRSHLPWSIIPDHWRQDRYIVPKRRQEITTTLCVITQKSEVLSSMYCLGSVLGDRIKENEASTFVRSESVRFLLAFRIEG